MKQEMMRSQWHQLDHMQFIYISLQTESKQQKFIHKFNTQKVAIIFTSVKLIEQFLNGTSAHNRLFSAILRQSVGSHKSKSYVLCLEYVDKILNTYLPS